MCQPLKFPSLLRDESTRVWKAGLGTSNSPAKGSCSQQQNLLPWNSQGILAWISLGTQLKWVLCGCLEWNHLSKAQVSSTSTEDTDAISEASWGELYIAQERSPEPSWKNKPGSHRESCNKAATFGNFWNCVCKSPGSSLTSLIHVLHPTLFQGIDSRKPAQQSNLLGHPICSVPMDLGALPKEWISHYVFLGTSHHPFFWSTREKEIPAPQKIDFETFLGQERSNRLSCSSDQLLWNNKFACKANKSSQKINFVLKTYGLLGNQMPLPHRGS